MKHILSIAVSVFLVGSAFAYFEYTPSGARETAVGGQSAAFSGSAECAYANAAGLADLKDKLNVAGGYGLPVLIDDVTSSRINFAAAYRINEQAPWAVGAFYQSETIANYNESVAGVSGSYAITLGRVPIAFGATVKALMLNQAIDKLMSTGASEKYVSMSPAVDLSCLVKGTDKFQFGVTAKNVYGGVNDAPLRLALGCAVRDSGKYAIGAEANYESGIFGFSFGGEYCLYNLITCRAGIGTQAVSAGIAVAIPASEKIRPVIEYAFQYNYRLLDAHYFGVSFVI